MSTDSATIGDVQAVVDAYFDGINEERYEDVGRLFAPDAVLEAPGIRPRRGPESIAAYFGMALARYPAHHDGPTRRLIDGSSVIVEISFVGALASGAPMTFDALDVFDFDEQGRIAKLVTWYDSHVVRARLVAAESADPAAAPERARLGSLAEATPARTRAALAEVRQGRSVSVGVAAHWRRLPGEAVPVAARAVLLDLAGTPPATAGNGDTARSVAGVLAEQRTALTPGDVLLVRTGGAAVALDHLPLAGLAAVAADGAVVGEEAGLAIGEHWDLDPFRDACHAARRWTGLLVCVGADAAIWI